MTSIGVVIFYLTSGYLGGFSSAYEFRHKPESTVGTALLQSVSFVKHRNLRHSSCSRLTNRGSHFTMDIQVGTPPQTFSVVVDTGSDMVIVPSCMCKKAGACNPKDRCFTGTHKSSTFSLGGTPDSVPMLQMMFGSGMITAVMATDVVHVGATHAKLENGLLLMVENALRIAGPFEGILGLGPPKNQSFQIRNGTEPGIQDRQPKIKVAGGAAIAEAMRKILEAAAGANAGSGDDMKHVKKLGTFSTLSSLNGVVSHLPDEESQQGHTQFGSEIRSTGFLKSAGISRFSLCFNDNGEDGALRLGVPTPPEPLPSVGHQHWALDFQGVSVGKSRNHVTFCTGFYKKNEQKTACGAIPDSGSTLLMGPRKHLEFLIADICDQWHRCRVAVSSGLQNKKMEAFMLLMNECSEWGTAEHGLDELPPLKFFLAGANGKKHTVVLEGRDYIIETLVQDMTEAQRGMVFGNPANANLGSGKKHKTCMPAFGVAELNTIENGPIWILGSPIFHKYTVTYDLNERKPSLAFSERDCGCSKKAALLTRSESGSRKGPRQVKGPLRVPQYDLSEGL